MKKLTTLFVALSFVVGLQAQTNSQTQDPEAKKILDKLSKQTKSYSTIRIKFSYSVENKQENFSETHKGYAFLKGNKYKLIIPGTEIFSDGKTVWRYLKDAEEMTISTAEEDDESIFNPAKLFTIYEKGFKYEYLGADNKHNPVVEVIDLYPEKPKGKSYSRVRLKVNKAKNHIYSLNTFGKDGNNISIKVTEFKTGVKIPESLFAFDKKKYPTDIDIIDMRE